MYKIYFEVLYKNIVVVTLNNFKIWGIPSFYLGIKVLFLHCKMGGRLALVDGC